MHLFPAIGLFQHFVVKQYEWVVTVCASTNGFSTVKSKQQEPPFFLPLWKALKKCETDGLGEKKSQGKQSLILDSSYYQVR